MTCSDLPEKKRPISRVHDDCPNCRCGGAMPNGHGIRLLSVLREQLARRPVHRLFDAERILVCRKNFHHCEHEKGALRHSKLSQESSRTADLKPGANCLRTVGASQYSFAGGAMRCALYVNFAVYYRLDPAQACRNILPESGRGDGGAARLGAHCHPCESVGPVHSMGRLGEKPHRYGWCATCHRTASMK